MAPTRRGPSSAAACGNRAAAALPCGSIQPDCFAIAASSGSLGMCPRVTAGG